MIRCLLTCLLVAAAPAASADPTRVHLMVDDTLACPSQEQVERAVRKRLPPELAIDRGPTDLIVRIEAGSKASQVHVTLSDGSTEIARVIPADFDHCAALADSIALLVEAWSQGRTWWMAHSPPPDAQPAGESVPVVSAAAQTPETSVQKTLVVRTPGEIGLGTRIGLAVISQELRSNGTGPLSNYRAATEGVAVSTSIGYAHSLGRRFILGGEARYAYAGGGALRYGGMDGFVWGVQTHSVEADLSGGIRFDVLGGLLLRLRLGVRWDLTLVDGYAPGSMSFANNMLIPPIPSDSLYGMNIAVGLDAPALAHLGKHAIGLRLYAAALAPAERDQTVGLHEGQTSSTYGAGAGASLSLSLYRGLALVADYRYEMATTHFTGQSQRDPTMMEGDRLSELHLLTLGAGYAF
jgi:hypothetical protein